MRLVKIIVERDSRFQISGDRPTSSLPQQEWILEANEGISEARRRIPCRRGLFLLLLLFLLFLLLFLLRPLLPLSRRLGDAPVAALVTPVRSREYSSYRI